MEGVLTKGSEDDLTECGNGRFKGVARFCLPCLIFLSRTKRRHFLSACLSALDFSERMSQVAKTGHPEPAVDVDVRALFASAVKPGLEVLRQGSGRPTYRPDRMADDASGDLGA